MWVEPKWTIQRSYVRNNRHRDRENKQFINHYQRFIKPCILKVPFRQRKHMTEWVIAGFAKEVFIAVIHESITHYKKWRTIVNMIRTKGLVRNTLELVSLENVKSRNLSLTTFLNCKRKEVTTLKSNITYPTPLRLVQLFIRFGSNSPKITRYSQAET